MVENMERPNFIIFLHELAKVAPSFKDLQRKDAREKF
jgi:hypothetical protein